MTVLTSTAGGNGGNGGKRGGGGWSNHYSSNDSSSDEEEDIAWEPPSKRSPSRCAKCRGQKQPCDECRMRKNREASARFRFKNKLNETGLKRLQKQNSRLKTKDKARSQFMKQLMTALFTLCHNCGTHTGSHRPGDILATSNEGSSDASSFSPGQPMAQMTLSSPPNLQQTGFEHWTDMPLPSTSGSASHQWTVPSDQQPSTSLAAYPGYHNTNPHSDRQAAFSHPMPFAVANPSAIDPNDPSFLPSTDRQEEPNQPFADDPDWPFSPLGPDIEPVELDWSLVEEFLENERNGTEDGGS